MGSLVWKFREHTRAVHTTRTNAHSNEIEHEQHKKKRFGRETACITYRYAHIARTTTYSTYTVTSANHMGRQSNDSESMKFYSHKCKVDAQRTCTLMKERFTESSTTQFFPLKITESFHFGIYIAQKNGVHVNYLNCQNFAAKSSFSSSLRSIIYL